MKFRGILVMATVLFALGVVYIVTIRPEPSPPADTRPAVWSIDMDTLEAVAIVLPTEGRSEAWVRREDRDWYFDRPQGPLVDGRRWGGGIPLLLSALRANRQIAARATAEQLAAYGFDNPTMKVGLVFENEVRIDVEVGDKTPDGSAYYVRLSGSSDVYLVDRSWRDVLARLVLDPPYTNAPER